jgi:hypothetical protein
MWEVEWGRWADKLRQQAEDTGVLPQALANIPELPTYLVLYHNAYSVLHNSRGQGFSGYLPVTIEAMEAYCRMFDVSDHVLFVYFMQGMDMAMLKHWAAKEEQKSGNRN